jgi:hypothetical protein
LIIFLSVEVAIPLFNATLMFNFQVMKIKHKYAH